MNNTVFGICFLALVAVWVLLIINRPFLKQLIVKFRGRTEEVMNKDAMTPEGAADYYNAAIQEKEENYRKANQFFVEITGKLDASEKDLYDVKKELARMDQDINNAIDAGKDDDALVFQMKKENLLVKADTLKTVIGELKDSKQHQQEVRDQLAKELEDLKQEKEKVRAGANKTREKASGSKIAYETSAGTIERKAEQSAREVEARKKIEELKQKRGKA